VQIVKVIENFCRMIGMIVFAWGIVILVKIILQRITYKSCTTAIVVDMHKRKGYTDEGAEYAVFSPIFSYNVSGTTYTKKSDTGSGKVEYTIGQEIEIYYDSRNPEKCYIKGDKNGIIVGCAMVIMGLIVVLLA